MGGGVGVSINASHRVAGERFVFAMPEVGIGLFPDVGATYFLPRLAHRAGVYFALTGLRAKAGDAVRSALRGRFVPSAGFAGLARGAGGEEPVEATIARFAAPPPPSALIGEAEGLEACFSRGEPGRDPGRACARRSAEAPRSPRAARAAMLEQVADQPGDCAEADGGGREIDFDEALRVEYRIVWRVCRGHDFYEGVRAVIVDKDNRPQWSPPPSRRKSTAISRPSATTS